MIVAKRRFYAEIRFYDVIFGFDRGPIRTCPKRNSMTPLSAASGTEPETRPLGRRFAEFPNAPLRKAFR
ncbi:hypothetical protein BWD12_11045 [Leptospira santarosai serovar Bananal]|nr:hypothetical protein BWD11_15630 [Leptospira santarosai serovar Grippotyphosa]ONF78811.1 hypothetical protein BWD12_11045 [Leptospira santarosai serovar Bananal]